MDIKSWLEEGTGYKWKELRYLKTPPLPYNIFIDSVYVRGADRFNNVAEHTLSLEHYSDTVDEEGEKVIEDFLNLEELTYTKEREWLDEEEMFITVYSLDTFLEKIRKEGN